MANVTMSDGYCEALAYMIITQAKYLEDKNKSGAFISLFLQSIFKQFGESGLKRVIAEIKKELAEAAMQGNVKKGAKAESPFVARLRSKLKKTRQR